MPTNNKIWWVDTETTGLDPDEHGIVEIAAVIQPKETFGAAQARMQQYEARVCPGNVVYTDRALEVNGLDYDEIQTWRPIGEALQEMDRQVTYRDIIAGWNVAGFDIPMLKAAYKREGIKWRFHHHCIDLMVVANFLKMHGMLDVESLSLQAVGKHYGFYEGQFGPAHRALPDVKLTMAIGAMFQNLIKGDQTYGF